MRRYFPVAVILIAGFLASLPFRRGPATARDRLPDPPTTPIESPSIVFDPPADRSRSFLERRVDTASWSPAHREIPDQMPSGSLNETLESPSGPLTARELPKSIDRYVPPVNRQPSVVKFPAEIDPQDEVDTLHRFSDLPPEQPQTLAHTPSIVESPPSRIQAVTKRDKFWIRQPQPKSGSKPKP